MCSYFVSYLGFWSTELLHSGAILLIHCLSSLYCQYYACWCPGRRLEEPGHQQAWYWPNKPEHSVSSITRVKNSCYELTLFDISQSSWFIAITESWIYLSLIMPIIQCPYRSRILKMCHLLADKIFCLTSIGNKSKNVISPKEILIDQSVIEMVNVGQFINPRQFVSELGWQSDNIWNTSPS